MNITCESHRTAIVISLNGELTVDSEDQFKRTVQDAWNESPSNVILDCEALNMIDSIGLESFLWLSDLLAQSNHQLRCANVNETITQIFEFTRLDRVFSVHDEIEEAARSIGS
ncbi:MAG: STAS domain-containing protein [Planctomycetota bacterium]|nr:STAS domain-containing protein [Planctomycetota bacterium]